MSTCLSEGRGKDPGGDRRTSDGNILSRCRHFSRGVTKTCGIPHPPPRRLGKEPLVDPSDVHLGRDRGRDRRNLRRGTGTGDRVRTRPSSLCPWSPSPSVGPEDRETGSGNSVTREGQRGERSVLPTTRTGTVETPGSPPRTKLEKRRDRGQRSHPTRCTRGRNWSPGDPHVHAPSGAPSHPDRVGGRVGPGETSPTHGRPGDWGRCGRNPTCRGSRGRSRWSHSSSPRRGATGPPWSADGSPVGSGRGFRSTRTLHPPGHSPTTPTCKNSCHLSLETGLPYSDSTNGPHTRPGSGGMARLPSGRTVPDRRKKLYGGSTRTNVPSTPRTSTGESPDLIIIIVDSE